MDKSSMRQLAHQAFRRLRNLTKWQKRLILCLLVFCGLFFFSLLNAHAINNPTWLEGTWSDNSEQYSIEAKNEDHKYWNIRQNGFILMKNAQIAANSSRANIILTRKDSQTEYHIAKREKDQLELKIFNNQKKIKTMKLHKVN